MKFRTAQARKKHDLAALVDPHQASFFKHRPSLLVLGISILITCMTFIKMRDFERSRLQNEFEEFSKSMTTIVRDSLDKNLEVLNEVSGFYSSFRKIERKEFEQFSKFIFHRRSDIYMLGWAPRVDSSELPALMREATSEGLSNFTIKQFDHRGIMVPTIEHETYYPTYFVEPFDQNKDVLGLDQASWVVTRQPMNKSLESGEPASTLIIPLPQFEKEPPASRFGFQVFTPIYKNSAASETFEDRTHNVAGYAVVSFHVIRMLESVLRKIETPELEMRIYADALREKDKLIYTYNPQRAKDLENSWQTTSHINVAGHTWTIICSSTKVFRNNHAHWEAPLVFIIGVLLGFLLAVYVFSFERTRIREIMVALSLTDELTKIYNRRGFWLLSDEQIRLAIRNKRGFWLLIVDIDNMKRINDTLGHPEGDRALARTVQVFRDTFRKSDIVARIGGDEFAIIALEAAGGSLTTLLERLQQQLKRNNAGKDVFYELAFSVGSAYFDPLNPCTFDELVDQADKALYTQKKAHHTRGAEPSRQ